MSDAVDHPSHYGGADNPYEVIKVAEAWDFDKDAYLFNVLKYIARPGKGQHLQDLKKAAWYLARKISAVELAEGVADKKPEHEQNPEAVAGEWPPRPHHCVFCGGNFAFAAHLCRPSSIQHKPQGTSQFDSNGREWVRDSEYYWWLQGIDGFWYRQVKPPLGPFLTEDQQKYDHFLGRPIRRNFISGAPTSWETKENGAWRPMTVWELEQLHKVGKFS